MEWNNIGVLAASVRARASRETSPIFKTEWENLAETYMRLADQSEDASAPTYDPIGDIQKHSH